MHINQTMLRQLPFELRVEISENLRRKQLTQSELAEVQRLILQELRKDKIPGRRTDLLKRDGKRKTSEKDFSEVRATQIVGSFCNESHKQVEKRLAVVDAAKAEPKRFGKLLADMDRSGKVNPVYRRLRVAQQAASIRGESPPLPGRGPYRVIVADPPWPFEIRQEDPSHRAARPYPTLSIKQICGVDVAGLAHEDCIVWLWTINYYMREAYDVLAAWGFEAKTILTWAKDRAGFGSWLRSQTEHCIMAVRGKPVVTLTNQTTLLHAPVRGHSVKPVEFYDLVESLCPAPRYADLFSRYRHGDKWDTHGDESPDHVQTRNAS
jgi:N6-adenosine-specific RNA methylase IME4